MVNASRDTALRKHLLRTSSSVNKLIGKFFHSFTPLGEVSWQGFIVDEPQPGWYLVQLLEWFCGYPSDQVLVNVVDMKGWHFYDSNTEMQSWYAAHGDRLHNLAQKKAQQELIVPRPEIGVSAL